jgi:hypothetical protein
VPAAEAAAGSAAVTAAAASAVANNPSPARFTRRANPGCESVSGI